VDLEYSSRTEMAEMIFSLAMVQLNIWFKDVIKHQSEKILSKAIKDNEIPTDTMKEDITEHLYKRPSV